MRLQKTDLVRELVSEHDCRQYTILAADTNEFVCLKCGAVDAEETARLNREMIAQDGALFTATDHNPGNSLLSSIGEQNGYVSRRAPGIAMRLHASGVKLNNAYKSGLVADPSKGCHIEEDPLTHKVDVKFSRYDIPTLQLMKEKALQRCVTLGLDTVQQTLISKEITRVYSHVVMNSIVDFAVAAALHRYGHYLSANESEKNAQDLVRSIEGLRREILAFVQGPVAGNTARLKSSK